jgi:hypothetical protein
VYKAGKLVPRSFGDTTLDVYAFHLSAKCPIHVTGVEAAWTRVAECSSGPCWRDRAAPVSHEPKGWRSRNERVAAVRGPSTSGGEVALGGLILPIVEPWLRDAPVAEL